MSGGVDTNINNYTVAELLAILNIQDGDEVAENVSPDDVIDKTDEYIERYTNEKNSKMATFFRAIQQKLLNYLDHHNDSVETDAFNEWNQSPETIPQKDKTQTDKLTDRKNKVKTYNNNHLPQSREKLGVGNTYNVDVVQDGNLNPTLKNTIQRQIIIDSFYRADASVTSASDYTLDLSDHLRNVLSLRLWSIQIPMTFYNIDEVHNIFWIVDVSQNVNVPIIVPPGNYNNAATLVNTLNQIFYDASFSPQIPYATPPPPYYPIVSYNEVTNKVTIDLSGIVYHDLAHDVSFNPLTSSIVFYDVVGNLENKNTQCVQQQYYINKTLGWTMGYHNNDGSIPMDPSGNTADSAIDLNGPRYFILAIDDFNQNHLNNSLVSITEMSKIVKPSANYGLDISGGYVPLYTTTGCVPQYLPTPVRSLTQSQLYSINEIVKNNITNNGNRAKAPTTTDVFAIIPIKQGTPYGALYVDFSGQLQDSKRTYFGPVNIDRLRVRLFDDKGNPVNLNGADWSFTLLCEMLYQY